jgi:hypothetical protein
MSGIRYASYSQGERMGRIVVAAILSTIMAIVKETIVAQKGMMGVAMRTVVRGRAIVIAIVIATRIVIVTQRRMQRAWQTGKRTRASRVGMRALSKIAT